MPNTVPAADEGLPTINRRSALAKLGLGLAASTFLAATAIAAPDAASRQDSAANRGPQGGLRRLLTRRWTPKTRRIAIYAARRSSRLMALRRRSELPINSTIQMGAGSPDANRIRFYHRRAPVRDGELKASTAFSPRLSEEMRRLAFGDIASGKREDVSRSSFKAQEAVKEASWLCRGEARPIRRQRGRECRNACPSARLSVQDARGGARPSQLLIFRSPGHGRAFGTAYRSLAAVCLRGGRADDPRRHLLALARQLCALADRITTSLEVGLMQELRAAAKGRPFLGPLAPALFAGRRSQATQVRQE